MTDDTTQKGRLASGVEIPTLRRHSVRVVRLLGAGGQGEVYLAQYEGRDVALKFYYREALGDPHAMYEHLAENIRAGSPGQGFVWPLDLTVKHEGTFGYVMDLIDTTTYVDGNSILLGHSSFPSTKVEIDAMLHIAHAFLLLHSRGYCYQDMSPGNFFVDTRTGKVLVCDNDNVAPDGRHTGILGTMGFMAPEVVLEKSLPNVQSDSFSLAVVFFLFLLRHHPLEGGQTYVPAFTETFQRHIYGEEPVFVFDRTVHTNAPDPDLDAPMIAYWELLPDYVKSLFYRTFEQTGLQQPGTRPGEVEWLDALTRFRSDIVGCPTCGNEVITRDGRPQDCPACGHPVPIPYRMELPLYALPVYAGTANNYGTRIYRRQTCACRLDQALAPAAAVIGSAKTRRPALCNLSDKDITLQVPGQGDRPLQPKGIYPITGELSFCCNGTTIRIVAN